MDSYNNNNANATNATNANATVVQRFYIKQVYTENTMMCPLSTFLTVTAFIAEVQRFSANQIYNISPDRTELIANIEVVEAGQTINGVRSEDAPELQPDDNITMQEKYGDKLKFTAFYVRIW